MSRPLRIQFENAFYHVMNRGRRREDIFFDDGDRYIFLSILEETVKLFNLKIYAYVLMSNHYHLLVSTPDANLARVMRHINSVYTQKVNRKHKLEGSVFKGRYKSILIDSDVYFKECLRYIHRNPLSAGLVEDLNDYKWFSHRDYTSKKKRAAWLRVSEALSFFARYEKRALEMYREHVNDHVPIDIQNRLSSVNWPSILGNEAFKEKIKKMILGKDLSEVTSRSMVKILPSATVEDALLMFKNKIDNNKILVRDFAVRYCREELKLSNNYIARRMNIAPSTASACYCRAKRDKKYIKALSRCKIKI